MKTIWTVWAVRMATGEGLTLMVWIGYAANSAQAREEFGRHFDQFFVDGCTVEQGIVLNNVTKNFLTEDTLAQLKRAAGLANLEFYSQLHVNAA
jgi:hypothetical protein